MRPDAIESFVDMRTAAEFIGKDRSWVYSNQARLDLPRYKIGNQYRYLLSEVAHWVRSRGQVMS